MSYIVQKAIEPSDLSVKQAKAFEERLQDGGYWLQPKIDGCHVVILVEEDGSCAGILSSTGEVVKSCDHLVGNIVGACVKGRRLAFLGEVTIPGEEFRNISGAFRRQYAQPQLQVRFFDVVSWVRLNGEVQLYSADSYGLRHHVLQCSVAAATVLPVIACDNLSSANIVAQEWQMQGWNGSICDGAVLRDRHATYKAKRCRDGEVVKVKPLLDFDLEVVGVDLAKGEKTGKNTGALITRFKDGVLLRVATGMTQADVDQMHATAGENFIGKIVRVEALGHSGTGSLREPRYCGVRTDKVAPDF